MTAIGVSSLLVKLSHQSEHVQGIRYVYDSAHGLLQL